MRRAVVLLSVDEIKAVLAAIHALTCTDDTNECPGTARLADALAGVNLVGAVQQLTVAAAREKRLVEGNDFIHPGGA